MKNIIPVLQLPLNRTQNIFSTTYLTEYLIILVLISLSIILGRYHWKRRRLYKIAASIPGPKCYPIIGNALLFAGNNEEILSSVIQLTTKYESPVRVWLGHRLFFGVFDPDDVETILFKCLRKEDLYKFTKILGGDGLFAAPPEKWKRHRKIIMPTFNQKILDSFVDVFADQTKLALEKIRNEVQDKKSHEIDIMSFMNVLTLESIKKTALGIKSRCDLSPEEFVKVMCRTLNIIFQRMFKIWLHPDFIFSLTSYSKELETNNKIIKKFINDALIAKKREHMLKVKNGKTTQENDENFNPIKRKVFLDLLFQLSEEGAYFSDEELVDELSTIMIAGSDTSAATASFVFVMLGMHPEIQQKVYEETIEILGHDRQMTPEDLTLFQYTERVIKETMRLFPIGPLIVRAVDEDTKLKSVTLPAGCSALLPIIVLHRDAKYFPDPLKFDPDRFLPEEAAKIHRFVYLPFSGGPRNCIGIKYAMMVMKTMISGVVRKYHVSTGYEKVEDVKLKQDVILRPMDGFKVKLTRRTS